MRPKNLKPRWPKHSKHPHMRGPMKASSPKTKGSKKAPWWDVHCPNHCTIKQAPSHGEGCRAFYKVQPRRTVTRCPVCGWLNDKRGYNAQAT